MCIFAPMRYIYCYHTPQGLDDLLMCSDGEVLTGLWFQGLHGEGLYLSGFVELFQETSLPAVLSETCHWLDIYFSGRQPDFIPTYRIDNLTPFRKQVSDIMLGIPFGHTMTYGEIANRIVETFQETSLCHRKMSAQAVGGAVGWNPLCIIVPCHRVVGAHGNLTGYGGGMDNKIALLELEGHDMSQFSIPKKNREL